MTLHFCNPPAPWTSLAAPRPRPPSPGINGPGPNLRVGGGADPAPGPHRGEPRTEPVSSACPAAFTVE